MQKCLKFVFYCLINFNINRQRNIVSTPISIALSAICAIVYFHSLFIGTVAPVLCITVSQWEEETCAVIFYSAKTEVCHCDECEVATAIPSSC